MPQRTRRPSISAPLIVPQVHAVHRCEPPVLDHAAMLGLGLRHIVDFVVRHLEDERVSCVAECALLTVHWVERVSGGAVCSFVWLCIRLRFAPHHVSNTFCPGLSPASSSDSCPANFCLADCEPRGADAPAADGAGRHLGAGAWLLGALRHFCRRVAGPSTCAASASLVSSVRMLASLQT